MRPDLLDFETERLSVRSWQEDLNDPDRRAALTNALSDILESDVLGPLPPSLALGKGPDALSAWINDRAEESRVGTIRRRPLGKLTGLLILAEFPTDTGFDVHIGYLFARSAWGKGYASEMLRGFVAVCPPEHRLIGGVARDNPASCRVLLKAGFKADPALSDDYTETFTLQTRP